MVKHIFLFFVIVFSALSVGAESHKDSIWINGVVRPDNTRYPFKVLKHVAISLLKNDSVISKTFSDDSGQFQLKCAYKDVNTFQLLAEARSGQPVLTFDSVCPYWVAKSPSGYADQYASIYKNKIISDTFKTVILMKTPFYCLFGIARFDYIMGTNRFQNRYGQDFDTLCLCLDNNFKRYQFFNGRRKFHLKSFYSDSIELAKERADGLKEHLCLTYSFNRDDVDIECIQSTESNCNNEGKAIGNCDFIIVSVTIDFKPEKGH